MGIGTFLTLIGIIIGIFFCFFRQCFGKQEVGIIIGIAIPVTIFIIFLVLPKKRLVEIPKD